MKEAKNNITFHENNSAKIYDLSDIMKVVEQNALPITIIEEIEQCTLRIADKDDDEILWEIIAKNSNPKWKDAKEEFLKASIDWRDIFECPERVPLGRIGYALESHITTPIEKRLEDSKKIFYQLDNDLKSQKHLIDLLAALKELRKAINESEKTDIITEIANTPLNEEQIYNKSSFPKQKGGLARIFKNLFSKKTKETSTIKTKYSAIKKPVL